jgi:hypothetical protein
MIVCIFVFAMLDPLEAPAVDLPHEGEEFGMFKVMGKNKTLKGLWLMYYPCTAMRTPRNNVRNILPRQNLHENDRERFPCIGCGAEG